jgi:tetratricopeptide (TPR) repeat protein
MVEHMESVGSLDAEGTSDSKLTITSRGDDEIVFRSVLRQLSPAQYDLLVQRMSAGMGYGGTASHAEVSKPEDTSGPVTISYDYKRSKAGDWANLRTIPQLSPVTLPRPDEKDPPVQSLELGVPRVESSHSAMKLPDGWGVVLPEAIHQKSKWVTYDLTYKFEKGTLYAERRVEVLQQRVPVKDWKEYAKFTDAVDLGNEPYVQLLAHDRSETQTVTVNVASPSHEGVSSSSARSADAGKLVLEAYNAIASQDFTAAGPMLDQAKAINPKQARLWSTYGYLSFQRGDMATAVEDYQKELELHPDALRTYDSLADAQIRLGRISDAKNSLETWQSMATDDPRPVTRLVSFLIGEGQPAEAAAKAEAALPKLADGDAEVLRLQMGKAQLQAGMKVKGDATLVDLLQTSKNAQILNGAAYELADAGLELPLAETGARTAISRLEEETRGWTLDEDAARLRQKTNLLDASWDTLGWVLYREGKLAEARSYIEASWWGQQSAEVGKHLGDVAAATGDKSAALEYYELASATKNPYFATKQQRAAEKLLLDNIAALRKTGTTDSVRDEAEALQEMRRIPLGGAGGLNGVAEYKLLLSAGKVARAEPTGAKNLPGGVERLKKASLPRLFPAGSEANLMVLGLLNCHSGVCELVLEP